MAFKIGDKVRIKNVPEDKRDESPCMVDRMVKMIGEEHTIIDIDTCIKLSGGEGWNWSPDWLELVSTRKPIKFKVGDRVKCDRRGFKGTVVKIKDETLVVDRDNGGHWDCLIRDNGEVASAFGCDDGVANLEFLDLPDTAVPYLTQVPYWSSSGTGSHEVDKSKWWGVAPRIAVDPGSPMGSEDFSFYQLFKETLEGIPEKKSIMSKVTTYIKNLTLSAEEKLVRKYGLHDENGETTCTGKEAILEKFYASKENQDYLISIAQGLDVEAKEEKK